MKAARIGLVIALAVAALSASVWLPYHAGFRIVRHDGAAPLMTIMKKYAGQQAVLDQQLAAGTLTPAQWRQARGDLNRLRTGELQGAGVGSGGTRTGDPVVDGYYAILDKYSGPAGITDKQAEQDELDAYQAKLTPAQRDDLASRTGAGLTDTPTVRQYKQDVQKLSDAGWFDVPARAYAYLGLDKSGYPTMQDWEKATINEIVPYVHVAGMTDAQVRQLVADLVAKSPVMKQYDKVRAALQLVILLHNPGLGAAAVKWGFGTTIKDVLAGVAADQAAAP